MKISTSLGLSRPKYPCRVGRCRVIEMSTFELTLQSVFNFLFIPGPVGVKHEPGMACFVS